MAWHPLALSTRARPARRARRTPRPLLSALVVVALAVVTYDHLPEARADDKSSGPAAAGFTTEQAPNSRVALSLPAGYAPAKLYSGFENEQQGISFVILEAPHHAYPEMAAGFTPENLAKRGITDGVRGELPRQGNYVYMRARQNSPAGRYAKYFVLFQTDDQTVLVSANVPEKALDDAGTTGKLVEQSLASATTVPVAAIKELYKLGYLGPFKEAGRVAGTSKLFTLDGRVEPEQKGKPRAAVIVAPSIDKRPLGDLEATAKSLLKALAGYREITHGAPQAVEISGLRGVVLEAKAIDQQTGGNTVIHQTLLAATDGGYYRIVAIAPEEQSEAMLREFQKIAQSLVVF